MFFSDVDLTTFLILMLPAVINLVAIYHCYSRVFPSNQERIIWLILCVALPIIGPIIYFIFGWKRGLKEIN